MLILFQVMKMFIFLYGFSCNLVNNNNHLIKTDLQWKMFKL